MLCCISHYGKEEWLQPIAWSLNYKSINQSNQSVDFYVIYLLICFKQQLHNDSDKRLQK